MRKNLPNKDYFIGKKIPGYDDYIVKEYVSSGCNAHVFRAYNEKIKKNIACKVIPVSNVINKLLDHDEWVNEAKNANVLDAPSVVHCQFHSKWEDLDEGIDCVVLCYDYILGTSLKNYIKKNKGSIQIKFIRDYLSTIFQFLFELKGRNMVHGDLHSGNVLVESQSDYQIVPSISFRITDFGIVNISSEFKASDDYEQVANTLRDLLNNVNYQEASAEDRFAFNILNDHYLSRHLVEKDITRDEYARNPKALYEKLDEIDNDFALREGEVESLTLITPFDYLSCEQIGDSHSVLKALYSDQFLGLQSIETKNNLVLTGPRGCGKSTVFKSLSLYHRSLVGDDEPNDIKYVGIYYNCVDLYFTFPRYALPNREEAIDLPLHYLTATLLIEVVDTILLWMGKHFNDEMVEKEQSIISNIWGILNIVPPSEPGVNTFKTLRSKLIKERKRAADKQKFVSDEKQNIGVFFSGDVLFKVAKLIQKTYKIFQSRPFYFFIDDYSAPKITLDLQRNLNRMLMQRTDSCFFKLSTESPISFSVSDIDEKTYVESREYSLLNLGITYLYEDADRKSDFIEDVFLRRLNAVESYPIKTLVDLVGVAPPISNNEIARKIKNKEKYKIWGKQALADLCSGDIHYIISLVGRMSSEVGGEAGLEKIKGEYKIPLEVQNKIIRDEAGNFLNNLRGLFKHGKKLVEIVTAFGNVAHSYLMYRTSKNEKGTPPHQATRIEPFDDLQLDDEAELIYKELLRYSVFIEDRRGKSRRGKVVPRLWLRRFLIPHFNLTFSKRDSISLENEEIVQLLKEPDLFEKSHRLRSKKKEPKDDGQEKLI